MTANDVEALQPGDSVIGLDNRWNDELAISYVGPLRYDAEGNPYRMVMAGGGRHDHASIVHGGGAEIRGALCFELRSERETLRRRLQRTA